MLPSRVRELIGVSTCLLFALVARHPSAQARPGASSERATNLVSLDFAAASKDGRPITDLTAADVTVKIDGKPRVVRSLQLISFTDTPTEGGATGAPPAPLPPPYGSSGAGDVGRTFILALDDDSLQTGKERPLREAVSRWLTSLTPRDRVTLVTMPYGGVKVPITTETSGSAARSPRLSARPLPVRAAQRWRAGRGGRSSLWPGCFATSTAPRAGDGAVRHLRHGRSTP